MRKIMSKVGLSTLIALPVWILCEPWIAFTVTALIFVAISTINWYYEVIIDGIYLYFADSADQEVSLEEMKEAVEGQEDFIKYIKMSVRYKITGRLV